MDKDEDEPGMFFSEYRFSPTKTLKQSEVNYLVSFLFSKMIAPNKETGEPYELKEFETSLQTLVKAMMDLGIVITKPEEFSAFPPGLKKQFMVYHRHGQNRYNPRTMGDS